MERRSGTLEALIQNASFYLQPLLAALEDDGIQAFVEIELDVDLPDGTLSGSAISGNIDQCRTAVTLLFSIAAELRAALDEDDMASVALKASEAFEQIKIISAAIKQLRDDARAISETFTDPLASQLRDYCDQLFERLAMLLAIIYADRRLMSAELLQLIGVLELEPVTFGAPTFPKTVLQEKIHFNRLPELIGSPLEHMKAVYRWGEDDFRAELLLERLSKWLTRNNVEVTFHPASPATPAFIESDFFKIEHFDDGSKKGLSVLHKFPIPDNFTIGLDLSSLWKLECKVSGGFKDDFKWLLSAPGDFSALSSNHVDASIALSVVAVPTPPDEKLTLISLTDIGLLRASKATCMAELNYLSGGGDSSLDFAFQTSISSGELEVSFGEDGFLSTLIGDTSYKLAFDLAFLYSLKSGLQIKGSGGPEIELPLDVQVGPISISPLSIAIRPSSDAIGIDVSAGIRANLGPLTIVVDRLGLRSTFTFPGTDGNLGPVNLDLGFKPPNGVGLSLDAGGFKGGGFLMLDYEKGEYAGALELDFNGLFSVKAIGIINTKMPDGSKGFSLLIIITAEFTPIQLSFGFTLNGVGGIFGLNRMINVAALAEGIRTNAVKSILFPENIIANITRIISDIKQFFPQKQGHFVIGPMAKLGWGSPSIITVELGLLLDLPSPMFALVGVLKALLPQEDSPLLRLQVNFIGVVDFDRGYIFFRADLYDSRLLIYSITGSMAFLVSWGEEQTFALSVGGFHPDFRDIPTIPALPDGFRNMARIGISLLSDDNPRLKVESYFAVTSNTVQFGARVELYAEAAGFNIYGFLGYDVLFQFDPFRFEAKLTGGVALRRGSSVIAGIGVSATLTGPTPWDARGKASLSFLFFSITVGFHVTWGDPPPAIAPATEDLLALLQREFNDTRNWRAELPSNNHLHVSVREIIPPAGTELLVIHPAGVLTFSQRSLPLEDYLIQKFGNKKPLAANKFKISNAVSGSANIPADYQGMREQFAPGNFSELTDSEKLSRRSFENLPSGFKLTATDDLLVATPVTRPVIYELSYLRRNGLVFKGLVDLVVRAYDRLVKGGSVRQSTLSHQKNRLSLNAPKQVALPVEGFAIANTADLKSHLANGTGAIVFATQAEAYQRQKELIEQNPALVGSLQVVSNFELNLN